MGQESLRRRFQLLATDLTSDLIRMIAVSDLRPGPWQPRRLFDQLSLTELAASMKAQGVLTPLRVVPMSEACGYFIVAGERRWRAAEIADITLLPCMVMDQLADEGALRQMALLDNLHRANLRPGEEARAVAELDRLGMSNRLIADRLGKSQVWVSHRLAIAKLPRPALLELDQGRLTIEEARGLAGLLDHPDLVEACLQSDGKQLKARLGGYVPDGLGERVQAVRRALEMDRQRNNWTQRMRSAGHRVLDEVPRDGDRRYVKLPQGSDLARVHQQARLSCEAWGWDQGREIRYCDNPSALGQALGNCSQSDPVEQARQATHRRSLEREAARDAIIGAWLSTTRGTETSDLVILARERIRSLSSSDDRSLARLGQWLGALGDRPDRAAVAEQELQRAGDRRLIQLWFALELAHAATYSVVPGWAQPWLEKVGFSDSLTQEIRTEPAAQTCPELGGKLLGSTGSAHS